MMKSISILLVMVCACIWSACKTLDVGTEIPICIRTKIEQIKAEPVRNPPAKVYEWDYNGTKYYYISAHCCDIPSQLSDKDCNLICAPDGGFTGKGDGKCPDFDSSKLTKRLIWKDNRHLSEKSKVKIQK